MIVLYRILLSAGVATLGWLSGVFCFLGLFQPVPAIPGKTGGGIIGAHRGLLESIQRDEVLSLSFIAGVWIICFALALAFWLIFGWGYRAAGLRLPRRGHWLSMGAGFGTALWLASVPWYNIDLSGGAFGFSLGRFLFESAVLFIWVQMICLPMVYVLMRPVVQKRHHA